MDWIGYLRRIMNKDASETFAQATDSLEAISEALGIGPSVGLWMFGRVAAGIASTTVITTDNLGTQLPTDVFNNEFYMQVLHNFNAPGTAPEREIRRITDFVGPTQTFTTDAFSANVEAGDLVAIIHESVLTIEILGFGTLTLSSTTVPEDNLRPEVNNYFRGCLLMATEGAVRFQPRRILESTIGTGAGGTGIFTLDPSNPFTGVPGLVDYIIIGDQTEFVPAVDGVNNRTPSDVIGGKADTIPPMNLAPGATDSLVRHLKAILERIGQTPADPDDPILTVIGQRDDAATLDDMSNILTTSLAAKIRLILNRLSTDAFTATIQGAARTELDTMLAQLAVYFRAAGAALAVIMNPGAGARADLQLILQDLGDMLAGATGIVTFPAAAVPADGVSIAEVLRQIYNDVIALAGAGVLHEQADVPFNVNAALVEANIFDLSVANTRYVVRSLRLKCVDPGAETVTVRLYELVNNVQTLVDTFAITTANFATAHSLTDMFGLFQLAGDNLKVTVIATAAGPYACIGQYCTATAGV